MESKRRQKNWKQLIQTCEGEKLCRKDIELQQTEQKFCLPLVAVLLFALISLSVFTATIYKEHKIFEQEQIFFEEEEIK